MNSHNENEAKPKKKISEVKKFFIILGIVSGSVLAFCILFLLFVAIVTSNSSDRNTPDTKNPNRETSAGESEQETVAEEESDIPTEYRSALNQANSYANTMHMSKQGVYDQLVSEYGGQFKIEAAQYAIDNVEADWNANALASAKSYQDGMSMSPAAIHDQLTSEYGAKFTQAEADYAIAHLDD